MKKEVLYCVFCGEKNNPQEKKCKKCKEDLNPKNHLLKDYLKEHLQDDIKENIEDSILDLLKLWIIKHLYGIAITCAILLTGGIFIGKGIQEHRIKQSLEPVLEYQEKEIKKEVCEDKNLVDKIKVCQEGFTLENDICIKEDLYPKVEATSCPDGFSRSNNICLSNYGIDKIENKTCTTAGFDTSQITNYDPDRLLGTTIVRGECAIEYCNDIFTDVPGTLWQKGMPCTGKSTYFHQYTYTYTCNGVEDSAGTCHETRNLNVYYYCEVGTPVENGCYTREEKEVQMTCPEGTKELKECNKCTPIGG